MREVDDSFIGGKNPRQGKLIFLYQIKYDPLANLFLRFTSYGKTVKFQGNDFVPYVITHDSLSESLSGGNVTMNLSIANVDRFIQAIHDNNDLREKEVIIYTVAEEDLASPQAFTQDKFSIKDVVATKSDIKLKLSSVLDVNDIRIPKRFFFRSYCRFRFKGVECQYIDGTVPNDADCNKTLQRCRELDNVVNFGAFPSIPTQRLLVE